ncbi:hypothetical protein [Myroides sp. DF42-4-2]|uniref:hypothetical protein n=1 Tax=Myroides sp. DF42-4-2 TaxID=2746726 RepID=UPI002575F1C5|nr:hypothetical protein [Myroides sp. DF42-4-2]MDM1409038.1 hypothetical protein [Myroides sp. DF42-4-2]
MNNKKIGIQVEGGWTIGMNSFEDKDFFYKKNLEGDDLWLDNTTLFVADNINRGITFEMTYENENVGYMLSVYKLSRIKGIWEFNSDDDARVFVRTNHDINAFNELISKELNPFNRDLVPLAIGGWKINHNNLVWNISEYKKEELLFSATRTNLFIEVVYYNAKEKPFYVYYGEAIDDYYGINYELYKEVIISKEVYLDTQEELIEFLDSFLLNRKMK